MKLQLAMLAIFSFVCQFILCKESKSTADPNHPFSFEILNESGAKITLSSLFSSKSVVLIVNVASQCGYTDINYKELQALYERYKQQGFEIIAFPCNQFMGQEPGNMEEILSFARETYSVSFPIMSKIDVNGKHESPVYKWLKASSGDTKDIGWNFGKFLVLLETDGSHSVKRYKHDISPYYIEAEIRRSLRRIAADSLLIKQNNVTADDL